MYKRNLRKITEDYEQILEHASLPGSGGGSDIWHPSGIPLEQNFFGSQPRPFKVIWKLPVLPIKTSNN
jgi:hypothetical protein